MFGIDAAIRDGSFFGVGAAFGVFCPAVCRKIKASFVKLTAPDVSALEARVKALEAKIVKDDSAVVNWNLSPVVPHETAHD